MADQPRWPRGTPGGGHRPGPGPGRFRPQRGGRNRPGGRTDWANRLSDRISPSTRDWAESEDWWDNQEGPQYDWARDVLDALRERGIDPDDYDDRLFGLPSEYDENPDLDPAEHAALLAEQLEIDDAMEQTYVETLSDQIQQRLSQWSTNSFGTWLKGRGAIYSPGQTNSITGEMLGDPEGWKLADSHVISDATLGVYPSLQAAQEAYERWEQFLRQWQGTPREAIAQFREMERGDG